MEAVVAIIINVLGLYLAIGLVFAIVFLWKGIGIVDQGTNGSGVFFKILLIPGMLVFWPYFLFKWIKH